MKTSQHGTRPQANGIRTALLLSGALSLGFVALAGAAPVSYVVEDLGVLSGDATSGAWGINAKGDVVGWSTSSAGSRAFVYSDDNGLVELERLAGTGSSFARDINDFGDVVGTASTAKGVPGHAVVWIAGRLTDIGTLGTGLTSEGWAINNLGQVVGSSQTGGPKDVMHAFLYTEENGMVDLTPRQAQAAALDINDSGDITGYLNLADGRLRAFFASETAMTTLALMPGFNQAIGSALNASGTVAGTATLPVPVTHSTTTPTPTPTPNPPATAHMFRDPTLGPIKDLNGSLATAYALGINAAGKVVGYSGGPGMTRAILYTDYAGVQDLNSLISPLQGWVLQGATDINDSGQIAAYGYNRFTGQAHAVRLRPQPTPTPN